MAVEYDDASGRITRVHTEGKRPRATRLRGRALLPGFINVHSHAFQRAIRGRTQWRPANSQPSDFWSWRDAMYEAVLAMSPDDVYNVSRGCFTEMLRTGYTSVGEFHYLQRDPAGQPYANPLELHEAVLRAAQDTGIRIVLINTAYATGGVLKPLRPAQRRFNTPDLDDFLSDCDKLLRLIADMPNASMAIAPHSIRAVPREWLKPIHEWSRRNDVPVHMHVSEQTLEVETCAAAYKRRPVELLFDEGLLDTRFTAVHATHVAMNEIALIARARATVCACPTTERDLGDGFLQAASMQGANVCIAVGSDSQTVIDPLEEVRLIEYHERLRRNERIVLNEPHGDKALLAPLLLKIATANGARALKLDAGVIAEGALADFAVIDLDHYQLAGWTEDTLAEMIALSASAPAIVADTMVGGRTIKF